MISSFNSTPGKLTVSLSGDLIGGSDAMKFSIDLRESLASHTPKHVVVDASQVGFVNSSGLGMLIAARQSALEHGAEFTLESPGSQLKSLLNVTKLTELMGA
ncbi:MAG: STAS domain-containing protein [Bacteroidota bacterium]|nr:STAS domain-containing protein [Bacteroidota bacterium]MDP4232177.1 STAS domain-containing protein [Bacteroidota bacterium]MDP4241115.1 STAS domain-containing protein [Bacteroidota bacterium]MDP4286507.1 STAS domain-containing protein [Bacteroidota bacterium]